VQPLAAGSITSALSSASNRGKELGRNVIFGLLESPGANNANENEFQERLDRYSSPVSFK
jgi:hypothetical protein